MLKETAGSWIVDSSPSRRDCPTPEEVSIFFDEGGTPAEREMMFRHIVECLDCAELLDELKAGRDEDTRTRWKARIFLLVVVIIVAAFVISS